MLRVIGSYGHRQKYRPASLALIAGAALPFLSPIIGLDAGWSLVAFAVGMAFYIGLVMLTFYRLRDAGLSIWWLLPMIVRLHFGPEWELGHSIDFRPIGLFALVPVLLGWFVRKDDAAAIVD